MTKTRFPANALYRSLSVLPLATASSAVFAHPGDHGADWLQAAMHLLSEPDHLLAIALIALVALGARRVIRRRAARR